MDDVPNPFKKDNDFALVKVATCRNKISGEIQSNEALNVTNITKPVEG